MGRNLLANHTNSAKWVANCWSSLQGWQHQQAPLFGSPPSLPLAKACSSPSRHVKSASSTTFPKDYPQIGHNPASVTPSTWYWYSAPQELSLDYACFSSSHSAEASQHSTPQDCPWPMPALAPASLPKLPGPNSLHKECSHTSPLL